jgi:hypothetical protein
MEVRHTNRPIHLIEQHPTNTDHPLTPLHNDGKMIKELLRPCLLLALEEV